MTNKRLIACLAIAMLAGLQEALLSADKVARSTLLLRPSLLGFGSYSTTRRPLTKVASGFGFTEGPVWDPAGYLWVSDETLNKIFKVDTDTGQKQRGHLSRRS